MDVGLTGEFAGKFLSFSPAAPQCRRQPLEAALHVEAPAAPAAIHTHRPYNLNLLAPWELRHKLTNPVKFITRGLDHYAARQVAGHDIPLELLQDCLLETTRQEEHTLQRLLPRNRLAAIEMGNQILLFHTTGEAGDVVSLTLLTKTENRKADPGDDVPNQTQVQARLVAECRVGRCIDQLAVRNLHNAASASDPCWLAVSCMHKVYILMAVSDSGARGRTQWQLSVVAEANCPAPCLHCVWSPALPEVAAVLSDGHLITLWCADVISTQPTQRGRSMQAQVKTTVVALKPNSVVKPEEAWRVGSVDLEKSCPACEYGRHPRSLLYTWGPALMLAHIPPVVPLPPFTQALQTPEPTLLCTLPDGENFTALSRSSSSLVSGHPAGSAFLAAATTSRLLLIDLRRPHRPILAWNHRMQLEPPRVCALHLTVVTSADVASAKAQNSVPAQHDSEFNLTQLSSEPSPLSQVNMATLSQAMLGTQASQAWDASQAPAASRLKPTHRRPPPVGSLLGLITCAGFMHGEHRCAEFTYIAPEIGLKAGSRQFEAGTDTPATQPKRGRQQSASGTPIIAPWAYARAEEHATPTTSMEPSAKRARMNIPSTPSEMTPAGMARRGGRERAWISVVKLDGAGARQTRESHGAMDIAGDASDGLGAYSHVDMRGPVAARPQAAEDVVKAPWVLHQCADIFSPSPVNSPCAPLHTYEANQEHERVMHERMKLYIDIASRRRWQTNQWDAVFQAEALEEVKEILAVRESAPDCQGSILLWLPASPHWPASGLCHSSPSTGPLLVRCTADGDLMLQPCWWLNHLSEAGVQRVREPLALVAEVDEHLRSKAPKLESGVYTRICTRLWKDEWKRHQSLHFFRPPPLPESNINPININMRLPFHFTHFEHLLSQPRESEQQAGQRRAPAPQGLVDAVQQTASRQEPPSARPQGRSRRIRQGKKVVTVDLEAVQDVLQDWNAPIKGDTSGLSAHPLGGPTSTYTPVPEHAQITKASNLLLSSHQWAQQHQPHLLVQYFPTSITRLAAVLHGRQTLPQDTHGDLATPQHSRADPALSGTPSAAIAGGVAPPTGALDSAWAAATTDVAGNQVAGSRGAQERGAVSDDAVPEGGNNQGGVAVSATDTLAREGDVMMQPTWVQAAPHWRTLLLNLLTAVRVGRELDGDESTGMERQDPEVLRGQYYGTRKALPWKCPYCRYSIARFSKFTHLRNNCKRFNKELKALGSAGALTLSPVALQLAADGDIQGAATLAAVLPEGKVQQALDEDMTMNKPPSRPGTTTKQRGTTTGTGPTQTERRIPGKKK